MKDRSPLLDTYEQLPFRISKGEGIYVWDESGNRYLDLYGGHAVALLGHSPKAILDCIDEQGRKLFFYSNIAPLRIRDEAALVLSEIVHSGLKNMFFCNSGAEANENALKLAISLSGREKLASFKGAFHGRTLLSLAVTDSPKAHSELGQWIGDRVVFLEPNATEGLSCITTDTAAVILEPIQSIAGVREFSLDFLREIRARCDQVGAYLIFDEVQTGFGRTGDPFISGYCGVNPDMFTTAKGIGSGYPIGALFVSDAIAARVKIGDLGSTYGAGPVAMAVVMANVRELTRRDLFEHVKSLMQLWGSLSEIPGVTEVRGKGCIIGIATKKRAKDLTAELLRRGIIVGESKDPYAIRLLPPLTITAEHISNFASSLRGALQ